MLVLLVILAVIIACLWKWINTFPMQVELDKISQCKSKFQVICGDWFKYEPDKNCINCLYFYRGCPQSMYQRNKHIQNKNNLANTFTAEACPARFREATKAFK